MRRLISLVSAIVALVGLGFVLVNATTVDRRAPAVKSISLSAPAGDPTLAQTVTAIDVEFSEPVRTRTAEDRFRIDPIIDGAFKWDGSTAIFTPSLPLPQDTTFTVSILPGVEDLEGNVDPAGLEAWTFQTVGAPTVLHAAPPDGATGVALDGSIDVTFDRLMDTTSVEQAITLDPAAPVGVAWRGSVVTLTLGPGLAPGTLYTLTIGVSAADTGGSRLRAPFRLSFTTAGSGLGITGVVPADGVAGIGINSPVAVRFDGPIDPISVQGALHVTPAVNGGVRVISLGRDGSGLGSPSEASGDTLVFIPSIPLAAHTTYTVTLDPVVYRLGDQTAIARGRTWSFTTGAPTASGQNQIGFLSARGGVRNVWVMNPDGTNQRQLTTELLPVTSFETNPDGSEIVYASGGVVTIMAIDGTRVRRVTQTDGRLEYGPSLVPGEAGLIVARRSPMGADLGYWLLPYPGQPGKERQLLDHGAPAPDSSGPSGEAAPSGDGTSAWAPRIAVDPGGRHALLITAAGEAWLVEVEEAGLGGGLQRPLPVALTADAGPTWVTARGSFALAVLGTGGDRRLVGVDLRGALVTIDGMAGASGSIDLSADGSLAFAVRRTDGTSVMRVLSNSGRASDFGGSGVDDRWPSFAPDGLTMLTSRTVAVGSGFPGGIWRLDLATGRTLQLTVDGDAARWIP